MKRAAFIFAIVGIASGVLLVIAPFYFGTPTGSVASFIMPGVFGGLLIATHRLNLKRLRDPYSSYPRARLLIFNGLLLAFFALAFIVLYQRGESFRQRPIFAAMFLLLGPLPLFVNALNLTLSGAKTMTPNGERPK